MRTIAGAWDRVKAATYTLDRANNLMALYAEGFVEDGASHWVDFMREQLVVVRTARAELDVARARWHEDRIAPRRVVLGPVAEDYVREMVA